MSKLLAASIIVVTVILPGCRSTSNDRLPATAVDNPDPIFGGAGKAKQEQPPPGAGQSVATPTGQSKPNDRIGPLQVNPASTSKPIEPTSGASPGTANLTSGVKPPVSEPIKDQAVQPAANTVPASSPEVVQDYRQRMNKFGVAGLRTKALPQGGWEAVGHFPTANQPNQLRRIEAHGATEADALLAILEQLEKPQ